MGKVIRKKSTKKRKPRASVAEMIKREKIKLTRLQNVEKLQEIRQQVKEKREELGL